VADRQTGGTDRLMEHEVDGIREYDNPMPRWWLLTFAGTVIFSVIYAFNIGPVGSGPGRIALYEAEMKAAAEKYPQPSGGASGAELAALVADAGALASGKEAYASFCAACHAPDGGGLIGPNLTDAYWLHGGTLEDIYRTVAQGVLEKGMPPWEKSLKPEQLRAVVAYVASLKGTTPANPKAPQGALVPQ
jgi:cytochrome c oxidase cbb3-type subunit 3